MRQDQRAILRAKEKAVAKKVVAAFGKQRPLALRTRLAWQKSFGRRMRP